MVNRRLLSLGLLICYILAAPVTPRGRAAAASPAGPVVTSVVTNQADYPNGQVPRSEKFEVTLTLSKSYANPFDPAEIRVDGYFTSPAGAALVQPGFYYQAYQLTTVNGVETYTPRKPGLEGALFPARNWRLPVLHPVDRQQRLD